MNYFPSLEEHDVVWQTSQQQERNVTVQPLKIIMAENSVNYASADDFFGLQILPNLIIAGALPQILL